MLQARGDSCNHALPAVVSAIAAATAAAAAAAAVGNTSLDVVAVHVALAVGGAAT